MKQQGMHACQQGLHVHYMSLLVCMCDRTWVATAEELASAFGDIPDIGDVPDIGDDCGELSPDGDGELSEDVNEEGVEEAEDEAETDVMTQRSNPDPVSELTKLVRPQPVAELVSHPLEVRYVSQESRPCGRLIV